MEPTTKPPFSAPLQPARTTSPKGTASPILTGLLWVGAVILWLATVGVGWLLAFFYAADRWGGGWLFGSGIEEPFYGEVVVAINVTAILLALVPLVALLVRANRKASR